MLDRKELVVFIRTTAIMICDEQPDVPEPNELTDLDSFSIVQVVLEIENHYEITVLEQLEDFTGETFQELADYIVECEQNPKPPADAPAEPPAELSANEPDAEATAAPEPDLAPDMVSVDSRSKASANTAPTD